MKNNSVSQYYKNDNLPWLTENTILLVRAGSHAYGTNTSTSDLDFRGVCYAPLEYYLGFLNNFEQVESKDPYDLAIFELQKFIKLTVGGNPSMLESLFIKDDDVIFSNEFGDLLRENRKLFVSKKCQQTFGGFAKSQLHRIKNHHAWLNKEVKEPPTRKEFGLPEKSVIKKDQLMAAMADIKKKIEEWDINWDVIDYSDRILIKDRLTTMLGEIGIVMSDKWIAAAKTLGYEDNFIQHLQLEQKYKQACADWDSYLGWKKNRNPQRAILEEKYGYDSKHALHLVRLLKMCREIALTGEVIVKRPDAEELLEIRNGKLTYEELVEWADKEDAAMEELYANSKLIPKLPNFNKLDELCLKILKDALGLSVREESK